MSVPYLILDCYYDEKGAAPNFLDLIGDRPTKVVRCVTEEPPAQLDGFAGLFITGSKASLLEPEPWMQAVVGLCRQAAEGGLPTLGICFGHQLIAEALAGPGAVRVAPRSELGWESIRRTAENPLLEGLEPELVCFVSHFDEVTPGKGRLEVLASSERCPVQAYQVKDVPIWGIQFHPEMDPAESETLVRTNLARHRGLEQDPEAVLARRLDGRKLGSRIFANFLTLAER